MGQPVQGMHMGPNGQPMGQPVQGMCMGPNGHPMVQPVQGMCMGPNGQPMVQPVPGQVHMGPYAPYFYGSRPPHTCEDEGIFGMIKKMIDNNPQLSSLSHFAHSANSDLIKGMLLGAGLALLLSNTTMQNTITGFLSGLLGGDESASKDNQPNNENSGEKEE
jgi:hypothetical protein